MSDHASQRYLYAPAYTAMGYAAGPGDALATVR